MNNPPVPRSKFRNLPSQDNADYNHNHYPCSFHFSDGKKEYYVYASEEIDEKEAKAYLNHALEQTGGGEYLGGIHLDFEEDDWVGIHYHYTATVPFERLRRITGYLTGSVDVWNDAKRAELEDRVKHDTGSM